MHVFTLSPAFTCSKNGCEDSLHVINFSEDQSCFRQLLIAWSCPFPYRAELKVPVSLQDCWELWQDRELMPKWMPWITSVKVLQSKTELQGWQGHMFVCTSSMHMCPFTCSQSRNRKFGLKQQETNPLKATWLSLGDTESWITKFPSALY